VIVDTNKERDRLLLDEMRRRAVQLSEHFDSVQIICTKHEHGRTGLFHAGCGNRYARLGSAREFLHINDPPPIAEG
jgi:hypothetical protein